MLRFPGRRGYSSPEQEDRGAIVDTKEREAGGKDTEVVEGASMLREMVEKPVLRLRHQVSGEMRQGGSTKDLDQQVGPLKKHTISHHLLTLLGIEY